MNNQNIKMHVTIFSHALENIPEQGWVHGFRMKTPHKPTK